jgi:hypothetical protein
MYTDCRTTATSSAGRPGYTVSKSIARATVVKRARTAVFIGKGRFVRRH